MRRMTMFLAVGLVATGLLATTAFGAPAPEKEKTVTLTVKGMT